MPYLAILRSADDTSLAIADDLFQCYWLGMIIHSYANNNSGSPPSCDCDFRAESADWQVRYLDIYLFYIYD